MLPRGEAGYCWLPHFSAPATYSCAQPNMEAGAEVSAHEEFDAAEKYSRVRT